MRYVAAFLAGLIGAAVSPVDAAQPPNIVFILADDLGYGDLGVTGHPYVQSPHLDRLAAEGIRFDHAYMSGAWCAPSRAALMSGVYPARGFNGTHVLPVDKPCLTRALQQAGYATAHFGKWHLGPRRDGPTPDQYGIDECLITNGTGPTWPEDFRKDPHYREKTTAGYVDLAIDFMTRNREQPFFINIWVYPTHSYINPTPDQLAVYEDLAVSIDDFANPLQRDFLKFVADHGDVQDAMRAYCADVTALDSEVGRLLKAMSELELADNTMVIFSSDNGPGPIVAKNLVDRYVERPLLLNNVGSSGPYRDRKSSLHDGGTHVPFIVRWPARISPASVDSQTVVGGVDLFPTLAALAGVAVPQGLDGRDVSKALTGTPQPQTSPLFWNDRPGWSALRDKNWKAHLQGDAFRLYDLEHDPSESHNLAGTHPEVAAHYRRELRQWEATLPPREK